MSARNYRTYTQEFKLEAWRLLESCGRSARQLECELGTMTGILLKLKSIVGNT